MTPPHKLKKRYTGTPDEVIDRLREDGHDTTWYRKHAEDRPMTTDTCGYFTIYLLEGEWAYTIDSRGEKYQQYRKLKTPEAESTYYCSGCKTRYAEWDKANEHRNNNLNTPERSIDCD